MEANNWYLVQDMLLLEELADTRIITLHEDTGKEVNHYSVPSTACYIESSCADTFIYKGLSFKLMHVIGAFYPYLFINHTTKNLNNMGDVTVKVTCRRFNWLLSPANRCALALKSAFYHKAPKHWKNFNNVIRISSDQDCVYVKFSTSLPRHRIQSYVDKLRNSFLISEVKVIAEQ
jgi:hypothetical protein